MVHYNKIYVQKVTYTYLYISSAKYLFLIVQKWREIHISTPSMLFSHLPSISTATFNSKKDKNIREVNTKYINKTKSDNKVVHKKHSAPKKIDKQKISWNDA